MIRPSERAQMEGDGHFIETLRNFGDNPPEGATILKDLVVLSETTLEIPFFCKEVADHSTALHTA